MGKAVKFDLATLSPDTLLLSALAPVRRLYVKDEKIKPTTGENHEHNSGGNPGAAP